MAPTKQLIFVLDDDATLIEALADGLAAPGRTIRSFSDPIRALAAMAEDAPALLITDLSMPWIDGRDVVASARSRSPNLKIVLMSGYARGAEIAARADVDFLLKPIDLDHLCSVVDRALAASPPRS